MLKHTRIKAKRCMVKNNSVDIVIEDDNWAKILVVSEAQCVSLLDLVCKYLADSKIETRYNWGGLDKPMTVVLALSNANEIRKLNADFRGKDQPTNVLSFANIDADDFEEVIENEEVVALGDIIMAWEVLQAEAKEKNISIADHFWHLLVHGILHLLGFDHQNDEEAEVMEGIEIAVLKQLNIDNPYKE